MTTLRKIIPFALLLAMCLPAAAQISPGGGVQQQGSVTLNHCTAWAGPGIVKDAGAACGAGSGTVSSVSVTTANGVSGSVATATTTPAITLTLGAITPTSVSPTGPVVLSAGTTTNKPIQFTSGTLLTSPLAGTMEFLTDAFYGTITTGPARKTFAFLESPSFTTPTLDVATATSLAIGGATIGTNALAVTGTAAISGAVTLSAATPQLTLGVLNTTAGGLRLYGTSNSAVVTLSSVLATTNTAALGTGSGNASGSLNLTNLTASGVITSGAQLVVKNGALASAGIQFNAGTSTGIRAANPSTIVFTANSGDTFGINASGVSVGTGVYGFSTGVDVSPDANFSRVSAGIVQLGTTAANALGSLNLTNMTGTGTLIFGTADATTSTGGALQVTGGASVAKRFWIPAISTSAGLQTAVLCQSSGGEMIADSVACLASSARFKTINGPVQYGALNKLALLPIERWSYKSEGIFKKGDWTRERIGPIAEDVAAMDPRLAGYDSDGNVRTYSTEQLLAFTIKALQELNDKVSRGH